MPTNKKKKMRNIKKKPFISVCTPTYNRRPFIKNLIEMFKSQTYPKELIEWIIVDDGTDKIEDLVIDIPQVKYFKYDTKLHLGRKRNITNEKATGDIIINMDDDDYYPPTRIAHAVEMLAKSPSALCAGSTELFIYYTHNKTIYKLGPYGKSHGTAGTFAYKKELLKKTRYEDNAKFAEEKYFLKNYTIPFVQLHPLHNQFLVSHRTNTFDKKRLLLMKVPTVNITNLGLKDFIKNPILLKNFTETIHNQYNILHKTPEEKKIDELPQDNKISGNEVLLECEVSGNEVLHECEISGNEVLHECEISGNEVLHECEVSGNEVAPECEVSGNEVAPECEVSGNEVAPECEVSGNEVAPECEVSESKEISLVVKNKNGEEKTLNINEIVDILTKQQIKIADLLKINKEQKRTIIALRKS